MATSGKLSDNEWQRVAQQMKGNESENQVLEWNNYAVYNYNIFRNVFLKIYCKTKHLQAEAAIGGVLLKKLLLKISQYSQENTCVGVSF